MFLNGKRIFYFGLTIIFVLAIISIIFKYIKTPGYVSSGQKIIDLSKEVELADGYIVETTIYNVAIEILSRIKYLDDVTTKKVAFDNAIPIKLLYVLNDTYVFRFEHKIRNLIFKYKKINNPYSNEVEISRRIERRELNHENIVKIYRSFYNDDKSGYFIVMEAMDCSLSLEYATKNPKEIKKIIKSVTLALQYLQTFNVIHGNISLENILVKTVNNEKIYKICDFSMAQNINQDKTYPKMFVYTESYVSPETYLYQYYTRTTDIWSLGHVIWFYSKAKYAFTSDDEIYNKELYSEYLLNKHPKSLTVDRAAIVNRCCAYNAEDRIGFEAILAICRENGEGFN